MDERYIGTGVMKRSYDSENHKMINFRDIAKLEKNFKLEPNLLNASNSLRGHFQILNKVTSSSSSRHTSS